MTRLALITLAAFTLGGCSILDIPSTTPTGRSFFDIPQTTPTGHTFFQFRWDARKFREATSEFRNITSASEVFMKWERVRREQRIDDMLDDMLDAYEHQRRRLRHPY